ncbi:MAG: hypothetical protein CM15mP129_11520 [Chloroflexota bacterium]|nr:MAG: hypothetical protein CM15mP129_11520 [Chloroflexota bacterium]
MGTQIIFLFRSGWTPLIHGDGGIMEGIQLEYHHEEPDTFDKLIVKDLKYYVTSFSIIFRLCLIDPKDWPNNPLTKKIIRERLNIEKNYEIRTS